MGTVEAIPLDAPQQRGKEIDLHISADSHDAGNKQTRRSRPRFMIYMNMSLINWYSKKQLTIEASVFGAEFVAIKFQVDTLYAL